MSTTLKKFYHKPTKTILTQLDWEDDNDGDFSLITSHHLANMGDKQWTIDIVANLEDCIDVSRLREMYDKIFVEKFHYTSDRIHDELSEMFGLDIEIIKQLLNTF